jgi:hypothetical protein
MTSKPKIPQEVIAFLKFITTDYFPELEPIRYLLSFRNGVYNVVQAKFYPYGQGSMEYRVVDSNGSATYKRWVSCNYIDNEFFDVNLDPTEFDQIELKRKIVNADGEEEQEKIADWRQVSQDLWNISEARNFFQVILCNSSPNGKSSLLG